MKKIPIVLEQYECIGCKHKWYINTEDKVDNKMTCPYGCEVPGTISRKFDMVIHNYEEYIKEEPQTFDEEVNEKESANKVRAEPSTFLNEKEEEK